MSVRFLADECFSGAILRAMQDAGFDIVRSREFTEPGASDERVLQRAYDEGRILLTEDYDFGDLVVRFQLPARGVVIVMVKGLSAERQSAQVLQALEALGDRVERSLVTIEPGRWRLRPIE